uniref:Uncharacterized protein n=1 Tax=Vespula pensylvanica TaxID=30213 RepID=A0A834PC80_VESPE|nr:hypothetical protein H0235_003825 [Vespula pensylvanica]
MEKQPYPLFVVSYNEVADDSGRYYRTEKKLKVGSARAKKIRDLRDGRWRRKWTLRFYERLKVSLLKKSKVLNLDSIFALRTRLSMQKVFYVREEDIKSLDSYL